jgi:hypothetical protein
LQLKEGKYCRDATALKAKYGGKFQNFGDHHFNTCMYIWSLFAILWKI